METEKTEPKAEIAKRKGFLKEKVTPDRCARAPGAGGRTSAAAGKNTPSHRMKRMSMGLGYPCLGHPLVPCIHHLRCASMQGWWYILTCRFSATRLREESVRWLRCFSLLCSAPLLRAHPPTAFFFVQLSITWLTGYLFMPTCMDLLYVQAQIVWIVFSAHVTCASVLGITCPSMLWGLSFSRYLCGYVNQFGLTGYTSICYGFNKFSLHIYIVHIIRVYSYYTLYSISVAVNS